MRTTKQGLVGTRAHIDLKTAAKMAHGKTLKDIVRKAKARLRKKQRERPR